MYTEKNDDYIEDSLTIQDADIVDESDSSGSDRADEHETQEKELVVARKNDTSVIAVYLGEIKKWPILSRERELFIAQTFTEAEHQKQLLSESWALVMGRLFAWKEIARERSSGQRRLSRKAVKAASIIEKIKLLSADIKKIDAAILQGKLTYYMSRKLCREKADKILQMHEITGSMDILKLYQQLQRYIAIPAGQLAMLESVDSDSLAIGRGTPIFKIN